jgi:dTDP-4-dehydrorhamnose reductase
MVARGKLLITGNKGQLGRDLAEVLSPQYDISGFDIDTVDFETAGGARTH